MVILLVKKYSLSDQKLHWVTLIFLQLPWDLFKSLNTFFCFSRKLLIPYAHFSSLIIKGCVCFCVIWLHNMKKTVFNNLILKFKYQLSLKKLNLNTVLFNMLVKFINNRIFFCCYFNYFFYWKQVVVNK